SNDEAPQTHEGADGGIHRKEIAIEHLANIASPAHLGSPAEIGAQNLAREMSRKIRLEFEKRSNADLLKIGLAEASFAQDFTHLGLLKLVQGVAVPKRLVALPGRLNVLDGVTEVLLVQFISVSATFRFARWRLEKVSERGEIEGLAEQGRADRL